MSVQYLLKGAFFLMAGLLAACGGGGDDDDGGGDNQKPPMVNSFQAAPNATSINTPVTFRWDVSDVNGDTLTCTLDVDGDSTVDHTISDCANTTSQAHTYTAAGSHSAKLTVSDGNGGTADRTVTVTVTVANTQPVFDSDFSVTPNPVSAGSPVTFGWDVSDTDGDTLTCTLDIDGDNAVDHTISDCANTTSQAHTYATAGDYTAKLTVDDGNGGMVEQTVSLTVDPVAPGNRAPMFDNNLSVAPNPVEKGDSATFSWDVSDADGDTLTCTLDVDGDSTVDYTIDDCANATTQTHTYAAAGDYTAKLSVDDGNGGMVEQTINLVVSNTAPVFDNNLGVTPNPVEKGDSATFSWDVSDADGDTLTCTLDVDADSSADYTIDDCAKTTSQAHTYAAAGDYIATLTVNDGNGSTVEQSVTITVNNATNTPPVIESFSVNPAPAYTTVATTFYWQVSDADGDTLTCKLDVDADGTDDYTIDDCVNMASRDYVYAASGNYAARLTVSDGINDVQTTLSTPLMVKSHLLLDVSAQGVVSADGRAPFTITVSNVSAQPLDDVSVVFTVPLELGFHATIDAEPNTNCGSACIDGEEAYWALSTLAAGESRTITINAPVLPDVLAGSLINAPVRVTSSDVIDVINVNKVVAVNNDPMSQLVISASKDPVMPNDSLTLTFDVGNIDNAALGNLELRAKLPAGVTVDSTSIGDGGSQDATTGEIVWAVTSLAVGNSLRRSVDVTVDASIIAGQILATRAELRHDGGVDLDTSAEYAVTVVDEVFPLSLDISATPDPVAADGRLLYDITVSNTSAVPVNDVNVILRVPPELSFHATIDAEPNTNCGSACIDGEEAYWALSTLAAGESRTITINAPVLPDVLAGSLINAALRVMATELQDTINLQHTTVIGN